MPVGVNRIRFATLNVRELGMRKKQIQIDRFLLEERVDILAVQETKLPCDNITGTAVENFLPYYKVSESNSFSFSPRCLLYLKKKDIAVHRPQYSY